MGRINCIHKPIRKKRKTDIDRITPEQNGHLLSRSASSVLTHEVPSPFPNPDKNTQCDSNKKSVHLKSSPKYAFQDEGSTFRVFFDKVGFTIKKNRGASYLHYYLYRSNTPVNPESMRRQLGLIKEVAEYKDDFTQKKRLSDNDKVTAQENIKRNKERAKAIAEELNDEKNTVPIPDEDRTKLLTELDAIKTDNKKWNQVQLGKKKIDLSSEEVAAASVKRALYRVVKSVEKLPHRPSAAARRDFCEHVRKYLISDFEKHPMYSPPEDFIWY